MALGAVGILVLLFYWRAWVIGGLNIPLALFWLVWPDVAAFGPIGFAAREGRWPPWGPWLYNATHTFLTWFVVFAGWSLASGSLEWPLLGWAGHITIDRAVGYYLRGPTDKA